MNKHDTRHNARTFYSAQGDLCGSRATPAWDHDVFAEGEIFERKCPLCATDNTNAWPGPHSAGAWRVKSCQRCDFVYLENVPEYEILREAYSWNKSKHLEKARRATCRPVLNAISMKTRWRLQLIRRKPIMRLLEKHARSGNVIDLGCGAGKYFKDALDGYIPHGVEIGRDAAFSANRNFERRGGFALNAPSLEGLQQFADGFFSAALLRSYLEHEARPAYQWSLTSSPRLPGVTPSAFYGRRQ